MDNHKEYWAEVERRDPGRIKLRSDMDNIDKQIAEKVMGGVWDGGEYYARRFNPSTNIAHAIKALEKMGWRADIKYNPHDPDDEKYWVKFPLNSANDWMGATTLERAISTALLAALEAVKGGA